MTPLNRSTCRRLKNLRQIPSVWEGDRYPLRQSSLSDNPGDPSGGDCILWVDGSSAHVRAMEMVSPTAGPEAMVRALLRAMEQPHDSNYSTGPARPETIVVRSRELQFFLRGILQDLDIRVTYSTELPMIDEIWQSLQNFLGGGSSQIPPQYLEELQTVATQIWHDAPWSTLSDEKIIAIHLNYQEIETLYLSFLGLLGVEFGVLMYRSEASLKSFRQRLLALDDSSPEQLEEIFLQQDCFFMTFEATGDRQDLTIEPGSFPESTLLDDPSLVPEFGSLHPLEGMRPIRHGEEALVMLAALKALHAFLLEHHAVFHLDHFPTMAYQCSISLPDPQYPDPLAITVSTMPELAQELAAFTSPPSPDRSSRDVSVHLFNADTVPTGTLSQFGLISWDMLAELRALVKVHQAVDGLFPMEGEGFPILLLQTSRPKALRLIETLQDCGGVVSVGFTTKNEGMTAASSDLGLFRTHDGVFHLFSEYHRPSPGDARQRWQDCCSHTNGYCGLIIAKGVTGAAKGQPSIKDMLALFETRSFHLT
ncbi:MAG: hypothetical protein VKJ64_03725 [Leptolyngbyaceae bacterium]|nr:hypothetical protein [Leptolyngbyaceae bacterium]